MSTIPESVTDEQVERHILPHLSTAKRGYVSKTQLVGILILILYRLHTGCQWDRLPVSKDAESRRAGNEPSWQAVYDQWSHWRADGSLEQVWQAGIETIKAALDLTQLN